MRRRPLRQRREVEHLEINRLDVESGVPARPLDEPFGHGQADAAFPNAANDHTTESGQTVATFPL